MTSVRSKVLDRRTRYLDTSTTKFSEGNEESEIKMMKERDGERREMEWLGLLGLALLKEMKYPKKSFYIFVFNFFFLKKKTIQWFGLGQFGSSWPWPFTDPSHFGLVLFSTVINFVPVRFANSAHFSAGFIGLNGLGWFLCSPTCGIKKKILSWCFSICACC